MSEFRRDPVIGRWVIISTERSKRPSDFPKEVMETKDMPCPFCVGNEKMTKPEILVYHGNEQKTDNESSRWSLRVVPNKYPVLTVEGSLDIKGVGMYDKMKGIGAHEVIIETPDHNKGIPDLPDERVQDIFWAYKERISDLKRDMRLKYIMVFKNYGYSAGATLAHSHSQLIATPIVPKRVKEEIKGARSYYDYKERCVFCDMVNQELSDASRVVSENDEFIAFCPFAARFPFEVWILPKSHGSNYEDIQKNSTINLASMMKEVLKKLAQALDTPPFNYVIHNAPLRESQMPYYHWHIEIIPKLIQVAGFEWGTGHYINPTTPEESAKFLRECE